MRNPAVVAWIIRALFSHSVEEYVLAIGGSNPALGQVIITPTLWSGGWCNIFRYNCPWTVI